MGKSPPLKTAGSLAPGKVYSKTIVFFFFFWTKKNHTKPDLQTFFSRNTGLPRRNLTHDNFRFQVGFCVCVFFPFREVVFSLHHPRVPAPGDSLVLAGASRTWISGGSREWFCPWSPPQKWNVNENCLGYVVQVGDFPMISLMEGTCYISLLGAGNSKICLFSARSLKK